VGDVSNWDDQAVLAGMANGLRPTRYTFWPYHGMSDGEARGGTDRTPPESHGGEFRARNFGRGGTQLAAVTEYPVWPWEKLAGTDTDNSTSVSPAAWRIGL